MQNNALTESIPESDNRPNLLVYGVGHSGTSVVVKVLKELGWNLGDQVDGFGEHVGIRQLNSQARRRGGLAETEAIENIRNLQTPWAIKDPRFVLTLQFWIRLFQNFDPDQRPVLLYLTRDEQKVKRTYEAYGETKSGEPFMYGHTVDELAFMAIKGYKEWPFRKVHLTFEQVIEAAGIFSVSRARRRDG